MVIDWMTDCGMGLNACVCATSCRDNEVENGPYVVCGVCSSNIAPFLYAAPHCTPPLHLHVLTQAATDERLYPNPAAVSLLPSALQLYEFLGMMLGKALYEGILLELPLAVRGGGAAQHMDAHHPTHNTS